MLGLVPALFVATDGAWYAPTLDAGRSRPGAAAGRHRARGRRQPPVGDYRILYLGDPRLIPFPSTDLGDGVAMAVVDDGAADLRDRWAVPDQPADAALQAVVSQIATTGTRRAGRLLAPYAIRSIVVPVVDGASSTATAPLPIPDGLIDALGAQLDLGSSPTPPTLIRFDNTAYIPTAASLTGALAEASTTTEADAVVGVDTSGAAPVFVDVDRTRNVAADVPAGTVHVATPLDDGWELTVGGAAVAYATVVRRGHRVRRAVRRRGRAALHPALVAFAVADRAGRAVGAGRARREPADGAGAAADAANARRDVDRPRRRTRRCPARRGSHRVRRMGRRAVRRRGGQRPTTAVVSHDEGRPTDGAP